MHGMVLTKVLAYIFAPKPNLKTQFYRDFTFFQIFAWAPPGPMWPSLFPLWQPTKELFPILPPAALKVVRKAVSVMDGNLSTITWT